MVAFQRRSFPSVSIVSPVHSLQWATWFVLIGLLSFTTGCGALQAQNSEPEPSSSPTLTSNTVVAIGRLIPDGDVIKISVANAQDSRVNQILVKEGDTVEANQIIAILQGRDRAEQQLREAEANVAVKRAQLLKTQQGDAKAAEITAQEAAVLESEAQLQTETVQRQAAIAEAEATLRNAEINYQRYASLTEAGAAQRSELDDAKEALDKAAAALDSRRAELENTLTTRQAQLSRERATLEQLREVRPVDIEIAQAELEQALIQVEQRRAELDDSLVRVPVAGQILKINTRVGEQVNTEEGIAELGRTKQMYVTAEVYETDIVRVKRGQRATIASEYGGFESEMKGTVDQIGLQIGKTQLEQSENNPTSDVNSRVVEVKIRLDAADSAKVAALTGMQVRVKIDTKSKS